MKTTLKNLHSTVEINHKGAELVSFKNKLNTEYIWEGNPEFWGKHSPILFPIVGTLKNNSFVYNDTTYNLLRHGFARDVNFQLISQTNEEAVFSLLANEETLKVYPFLFELQLKYTLIENELQIAYTIFNRDNVILPFSIGAHPAFALPKDFENYALAFDETENLISYQLENDLISDVTLEHETKENILPLTYSLFEQDALIFKNLKSKKITILENDIPFLRVTYDDFAHLGIWTKNNAPFICIEPWLGYSDTIYSNGNILEKEAIQFVEPKETFVCTFIIEIL
ncbi:aldose 1-epimerase family protein [Flavobacterium luteum]|uniref:Aldose 1-epimerase family protein n=1 Tax=Flavobacterium luteum TaxID=2026654 RepID=A0A7J5AKN5_9FLAO|nr:aldose 1-epimerase family protein [Flavobacterium luteum]KAB1158040.1 aldose 1-epimerase family protein [Flavobacterium luteum]